MDDSKSKAILKQIEFYARQPGFIYTVSRLVRADMFFGVGDAATVNWRKRITNTELNLLMGYMIKDEVRLDKVPSRLKQAIVIRKLRKLLDKLHMIQTAKMMEKMPHSFDEIERIPSEDKEQLRRDVFGSGKAMVEPIFYADSGAYDFQYLNLAEDLYEEDKQWLQSNNKDLGLYSVYCNTLKDMITYKASFPFSILLTTKQKLGVFTFTASQLHRIAKAKFKDSRITLKSAQSFIDDFKIIPGKSNAKYQAPGNRNDIEAYPIIELNENTYYINSEFNLAESIYNLPWIWMLQDASYRAVADENRGINIEKLSHKLLQRTFGENCYHSVKIKKGSNLLTDIDGLAVIGNKAIVFQEKSKWLTDLSKSGDDRSLAKDFKEAIQNAYAQGIVSRSALLNQEGITFELQNGTVIKPGETIDEVYIVCVTSSVYPAQISHLHNYLERKPGDPMTISISLLDLELMTYYLHDPHEFLYYIKQRIDAEDRLFAPSEVALLGYHLKHRLPKLKQDQLMVMDGQFGQLVDADLLYREGRGAKPTQQYDLTPTSDNELYEKVIRELKSIDEPRVTDIIIFLMGLSKETIKKISDLMQERIDRVSSDAKKVEDFSILIDDNQDEIGGLTYVVASDENTMANTMDFLSQKNKYLHKKKRWIAIGSSTASQSTVSGVQYLDYEWKKENKMEYILQRLKATGRAPIHHQRSNRNKKTGKKSIRKKNR